MLDLLVYLLYRTGVAICRIIPLPLLFRFGEVLGWWAWLILLKYRSLALRNAMIAFGNARPAPELRRLVRRHFQRLGANLCCSVKLTSMPVDAILRRVTVENIAAMDQEFRAGTPVVLILSHLATWELFAQLMPRFVGYVRNASVYQQLGNRFIDEHVRRTRSRTGLELFDRRAGFQPVVELLRSGGGVGVLSDQHAGDHGVWTPFFGRLASTSPLPALLAKRTRAAVIAAAVYTDAPARWRIVFTERFDTPNDSVNRLTAKINAIIEEQIRRAPEDWFWVHNRWKTPNPNFLLRHYKRGVYLPKQIEARTLQPFRILIRSSNWLGDAVMSVPAVRAIKQGRPDAHITLAAPTNIAAIWKLVHEVDAVVSLAGRSLTAAARTIRREAAFDVAILFPNSLRSALEIFLAGVPRRVGYPGHSRRFFLNQIVPETAETGPPEHHAARFLAIAERVGARTGDIPFVANETKIVDLALTKIGLCPGAEYGPAKRWPADRFAETAALVTQKSNAKWVLFGVENDRAAGEQIAAALGDSCTNRIGHTSIAQLIDELRECQLLLTNDTGTMHLAAFVGLPVVAIFGSTEPHLTGPLGKRHVIVRHHVECSPCFLRECPIDFRCMKAVSAQEVADAVLSILQSGS
jgi:lipopolysaccharide heptosyltransferase II